MAKKEQWLDPWSQQYHAHQRIIREAMQAKDSQRIARAIEEHLPQMIAVRNEVAALPVPSQFHGGLWNLLEGMIFKVTERDKLQIEKDAALKVWDETIGQYQREMKKMQSSRR